MINLRGRVGEEGASPPAGVSQLQVCQQLALCILATRTLPSWRASLGRWNLLKLPFLVHSVWHAACLGSF